MGEPWTWILAVFGGGVYVLGAAYDYVLRIEDEPSEVTLTALWATRTLGAAAAMTLVGMAARQWSPQGYASFGVAALAGMTMTAVKYAALQAARTHRASWRRTLRFVFGAPLTAMRPAAEMYEAAARVLAAPVGVRRPERRKYDPQPVVLQDLEREALQSDVVPGEILRNLAQFRHLRAGDCLVPRTEIVALPVSESVAEFRRVFRETGLSRIVVYGQTLDEVKGFVHVLGLFQRPEQITEIVQPALFVAEATSAPALLEEFNRKHRSAAIVVDEFGGVAG
ncbi:MAG: hypothetical protein RMM53_03365, partial [Bacteroidia bacterium]|nr:hypothetical protein [Bacteroidia bacterium]